MRASERPRTWSSSMVEALEHARSAMERHAWTEAVDAFVAADAAGGLASVACSIEGRAVVWH